MIDTGSSDSIDGNNNNNNNNNNNCNENEYDDEEYNYFDLDEFNNVLPTTKNNKHCNNNNSQYHETDDGETMVIMVIQIMIQPLNFIQSNERILYFKTTMIRRIKKKKKKNTYMWVNIWRSIKANKNSSENFSYLLNLLDSSNPLNQKNKRNGKMTQQIMMIQK